MKVLVISDSHGKHEILKWVLRKEQPIDRLLHLGDVEGGVDTILKLSGCPCDFVSGNCDVYSKLPATKLVTIGNKRLLMTHGHNLHVNFSTELLLENAKAVNADVVFYGHTHIPEIKKEDGIFIVNPGSISLPRQQNRLPSYVIMTIDEQNEISFEQRFYK